MAVWNPWHGCHKISAGCKNCYVYRRDELYGKDSTEVVKTRSFSLPIRRRRNQEYSLRPGEIVYTCMTSDFFVDEADAWRDEIWSMIKNRPDLHFFIITKRIHRFYDCIPPDWGGGYENVAICCTVENQDRADFRLPIFMEAPIRKKFIVCEPLLERLDVSRYLDASVCQLIAGGESGMNARVCDYEWILSLRDQCIAAGVPFVFKQTGRYLKKDGRVYTVARKYQHAQARKAGINVDTKGLGKDGFVDGAEIFGPVVPKMHDV